MMMMNSPCYQIWAVCAELVQDGVVAVVSCLLESYCGHIFTLLQHASIHLLDNVDRISASTYHDVRSAPHILIDVRSPLEIEICHLPDSLLVQQLKEVIMKKGSSDNDFPGEKLLFCLNCTEKLEVWD
jgi:hypothetical protein